MKSSGVASSSTRTSRRRRAASSASSPVTVYVPSPNGRNPFPMGSGGARMGLLLRHDDAEREYAYDRESAVGRLDQALDAADGSGWVVVSMKNDWKTVFVEE